jgi:hypothetical protein
VLEILQRFSVGNLAGLLGVILVFWAVWPVLCGVLGARRGLGFQGVMHGLLWGPLGLPVVLLSRSRHPCPTCGKRTLSQPIAGSPMARAVRLSPSHPGQAAGAKPRAEPHVEQIEAIERAEPVEPPPIVGRAAAAPDRLASDSSAGGIADGGELDVAHLRAWLNGEDLPSA